MIHTKFRSDSIIYDLLIQSDKSIFSIYMKNATKWIAFLLMRASLLTTALSFESKVSESFLLNDNAVWFMLIAECHAIDRWIQ